MLIITFKLIKMTKLLNNILFSIFIIVVSIGYVSTQTVTGGLTIKPTAVLSFESHNFRGDYWRHFDFVLMR